MPVTIESPRLLVVEDNRSIAMMLAKRLTKRGFEVICAASGAEALQRLERIAFDGMIVDQMMPGMTGIELVRHLRAAPNTATMPIVMVTAVTQTETLTSALEAGADDYVTKPVNMDALVARLNARLHTATAKRPTPSTSAELGIIDSRYELLGKIGAGGFGTVFSARHIELQRPVAIKLLHTRHCSDPEVVENFRQEGVKACQLSHPNAVAVHDLGFTHDGTPFLVMELLRGHTLAERVSALPRGSLLSGAEVCEIGIAVCDALEAAHEIGLVHRDVKPDNVFLDRSNATKTVKVIDFGIATLLDRSNLSTEADFGIGTPWYMAPERFGREPTLPQTDVFSLGVMLYELLAGSHPFAVAGTPTIGVARAMVKGKSVHLGTHRPDLPYGLITAVMGMLHAVPLERAALKTARAALVMYSAITKERASEKKGIFAITSPIGRRPSDDRHGQGRTGATRRLRSSPHITPAKAPAADEMTLSMPDPESQRHAIANATTARPGEE